MSGENDLLNLKVAQQGQLIDQYRINIYTLELRVNLLIKLLEEKGITAVGEFDKRWPHYLTHDVGAIGPDGVMEGSLKVQFYDQN